MSSTLLPISSTGGFTTTASMIATAYALPDGQSATLEPYLTYDNGTGNLTATSTIQMIGSTAGFFASATSNGNYNLWFNSAVRDADGNTYVVGGNQDNNNGSIWSFTSSGSVRWKTSVDDIAGENVTVESVRFDAVNNRVVVTLEWYDGTSDQDGWLALNPADGTYVTSVLLSTPANSNPDVYDLAINAAGETIMVGQISGEYVATSGLTAQSGSAAGVLWVNSNDLPIQIDPNNVPSFEVDTQPGGPANWVYAFNVNQVPELACETLTGTGSGATLQISWSGVTNTYVNVYANQYGSGYVAGDRLRVRGNLLGGIDNTDITATATSSSDVGVNTVAVFDKATYPTLGSVTTGWHAFFSSGLAYDVVGPAVDTGTTWEITVVSNGVDFTGPVMFTGAGNDCFVYVVYASGYIAVQQLWEGTAVQKARFQINEAVDFATGGPWGVRYALDGQAFIWTPNWQHTYGANDWQQFYSVAVNETTGDIYTLGRFYSFAGGVSRRVNLMKLDSSGVTQWSKYVEDSNASSGNPGTVAIDGTGNVYVFAENDNGYAMVTKLDAAGDLIWQSVQDNASEWDNEIRGAVDIDGNAYLSGVWYNGDYDVVSIMKLNGEDGALEWARFVENTDNVSFREFYDNDTQPFTVTDGKFIYAQYVYDVNDNNYDGFLMEMPTDGSLTGTYGRWIYTADNGAEFIDNTADAAVTSNSNGVPTDLITQTTTGDSVSVTANEVGSFTVYTLNASTSGGGGIMFADGTVQTTAASGGGGGTAIINGTSSATIADADGNLVINLNDGGAGWTFATDRVIYGKTNENMVIAAVDEANDGYQVRQLVTDGSQDLSRTNLYRDTFEIQLGLQGTYGQWQFSNDTMSTPQDTDAKIRGYNSNVVLQSMYSGSHGTASIQSVSNQNDPNVFSEVSATTSGANISVYNGGSNGGIGHIWQFDNAGNFTAPGAITASVTATTVATVSALGTRSAGTRAFVSDSELVASSNFGTAVTGGGSNTVPVWSDGTSWRIG